MSEDKAMESLAVRDGTLHLERVLHAPIERVWAHLVEPRLRARWLAGGELPLTPGATGSFEFDNSRLCEPGDAAPAHYADVAGEVRFEITVVEVRAPERLVIDWPNGDGTSSRVSFALRAEGAATRLTLTQTALDAPDVRAGAVAGWQTHLAILDAVLGDRRPPSFWRLHTQREAEFVASEQG